MNLYKTLLPKYKSPTEIRLKFVEGGGLGYRVILSNNKIEYEYNELMKDFRYKIFLLVQHLTYMYNKIISKIEDNITINTTLKDR